MVQYGSFTMYDTFTTNTICSMATSRQPLGHRAAAGHEERQPLGNSCYNKYCPESRSAMISHEHKL
jgi:hypothetical protein